MNNLAYYILLQRTEFQTIGVLGQILGKLGLPSKPLIRLDAMLRKHNILEAYGKEMKTEWELLCHALPQDIKRILDIGCGIGGIHKFTFRDYQPEMIVLADYNTIERRVYYRFHRKAAVYSSLRDTQNYLTYHGVPSSCLKLIDLGNEELPHDIKFDFIMSLLSWGYHYPIQRYVDYVRDHLTDRGVVLLDCRKGTGGLDIFQQYFHTNVILETTKFQRLLCTKK